MGSSDAVVPGKFLNLLTRYRTYYPLYRFLLLEMAPAGDGQEVQIMQEQLFARTSLYINFIKCGQYLVQDQKPEPKT